MFRRILAAFAAASLLVGGWAAPAGAASTGTITGTISAPDGTPATDVGVFAFKAEGGGIITGQMLGQGRYSLSVPPGRWKIAIDSESTGDQYVPRVTDFDDATVFDVADGQQITVDETLLARGGIQGVL